MLYALDVKYAEAASSRDPCTPEHKHVCCPELRARPNAGLMQIMLALVNESIQMPLSWSVLRGTLDRNSTRSESDTWSFCGSFRLSLVSTGSIIDHWFDVLMLGSVRPMIPSIFCFFLVLCSFNEINGLIEKLMGILNYNGLIENLVGLLNYNGLISIICQQD